VGGTLLAISALCRPRFIGIASQSAEDYEFYRAHLDEQNNVRLDGPVPEDSKAWVSQRLSAGRGEFARVGLPDPDIFEFPHYTASMAGYRAVQEMFGVRYDQGRRRSACWSSTTAPQNCSTSSTTAGCS